MQVNSGAELLQSEALASQRTEHARVELIVCRHMRARRDHCVEKRAREVEVRRAPGALLEMRHDVLAFRFRHGAVEKRPELSNDSFTL